MNDFFSFTGLLLIVIYVVYCKLHQRIKSLENQIAAQRLIYQKLRESNRELKVEMERIEALVDSRIPTTKPKGETAVSEEATPSARAMPDELAGPPPLPPMSDSLFEEPVRAPQVVAQATQEMEVLIASHASPEPQVATQARQTWEDARPSGIPEESVPSLFSRIPWRDILGRLHLLPPVKSATGDTAESQLAAWWVIRVGLVLLIIAAVFFGVYVSQHTPAWLRVMVLGLVSVGTISLGSKMKDKLEGFGRAIIGGGFALLYFTAFAAYALPATKVIDSPTVGALAQFAALIAAILWSLWKRDQTVATLTLFLGFVSCGFSHSHDLDRFATMGLVLLAATGAFLFATRGWLTSFITALVGSWVGFGVFALHDGLRADSPAFFHLMGTLLALAVVFEAGNLACAARGHHAIGERLRRWLILGNTSAAALLGYGVTRMAHPDQLSTFYFILAFLYFFFTVIHHYRTTDRLVTESLFLKSSALLCLGFATAFSGPLRWLAIAFQAFALLWTARRSGSRWIGAGFVLLLGASIAWFWRDLAVDPPVAWRWLDPFRIAGVGFLVFLTVQLGIHSLWFPHGIGGKGRGQENMGRSFRVIGAFVIGVAALALSFNPVFPGNSDPVWFLLLLAFVIGFVSHFIRVAVPCVAAALPLLACYFIYAVLPQSLSQSVAALSLGATLIGTTFFVSELIRRFWPGTLGGGLEAREIMLLLGLLMLLPFSVALGGAFSVSGNAGIVIFALFPVLACFGLWHRNLALVSGKRGHLSMGIPIAIGVVIVMGGVFTCETSDFLPSALAVAGISLLALKGRADFLHLAGAAVPPILGGFFLLWQWLLMLQNRGLIHDSINVAILLSISVAFAIVLWKRIDTPRWRIVAIWGDALLHALGIFSIHLFFQKYLGEGPDFFAAGLLGLMLFAVSRRFPFRVLAGASWLPVALACFWSIHAANWQGVQSREIWFYLAGFLVLVHLVLAHDSRGKERLDGPENNTGSLELRPHEAISYVSMLAWTLIIFAVVEKHPWQTTALTGLALLGSVLWRWRGIPLIGHLGLVPLAMAFWQSGSNLLLRSDTPGSAMWILTGVLLTALGIAANGMIMASAQRHILCRKITASSPLPWFHGGSALLLVFVACVIDRLVSDNLTTVFWGLSAILLFVSGLFAGLRAYRLTGLIGLICCTVHIFIWDIQDIFYRIIAFFVIGLVMLVIGFLYHRFRERITALDS
jgi:hypothetical protein